MCPTGSITFVATAMYSLATTDTRYRDDLALTTRRPITLSMKSAAFGVNVKPPISFTRFLQLSSVSTKLYRPIPHGLYHDLS